MPFTVLQCVNKDIIIIIWEKLEQYVLNNINIKEDGASRLPACSLVKDKWK